MKVDIAIMTIREDEFTEVRRRFKTEPQRIPGGRTYLVGEVKTYDEQVYSIAIARCSDQGADASQKLTSYVIQNLDPQLILVVGIAGGIPHDEFTMGDVIVSTRIVTPNVDAWYADGTTDYMTRGGPPHPLVEDIVSLLPGWPLLEGWVDSIRLERPDMDPEQANIKGDDEWRERVRKSLNWHFGEAENRGRSPIFTIGPIISSNHLMKDPARLSSILKTHRSVLAVEMEAAGVYEAAQRLDQSYPVMAIRGISDIVGLQRDRRWTAFACQAAAAFTYAFIIAKPIEPRPHLDSTNVVSRHTAVEELKGTQQVFEELMDRSNEPSATAPSHIEKTQHVTCYVTIPRKGGEIVFEALQAVLEDKPYFWQVIRADQEHLDPTIYGSVFKHIARAHCYIAEISEQDFNVGLELGIMQQFPDRPKILLRHVNAMPVPTDLRGAIVISYPAPEGLRKDDLVELLRDQLPRRHELKAVRGEMHYLSPTVIHSFGLDPHLAKSIAQYSVTAEAFIKADPKAIAHDLDTPAGPIPSLQEYISTVYDLLRNKPMT